MEDSETVGKLLAGDRRTLLRFYRSWSPRLLKYLEIKIANPADREETLQDTLFAVLDGLRDFEAKASLSTFIYAICNHKIIDYYRRKKIKQTVFSRLPGLGALVSSLASPEDELELKIYKEKIYQALGKLLPRYRQVLILKYLDNLTAEEIAQKLTVSLKSIESRLFRARKAFIERFIST